MTVNAAGAHMAALGSRGQPVDDLLCLNATDTECLLDVPCPILHGIIYAQTRHFSRISVMRLLW